jgi:hypothetical protein
MMFKKGGQKSAITMNVCVPRGQDGYWLIIRELDQKGTWTVRDVSDRADDTRQTVSDFIRRLVAGGYAEVTEGQGAGVTSLKRYRLLKAPVPTPRLGRDGIDFGETQNATIWRSIRMAKSFSAKELAEMASVENKSVKFDTVRRYLHDLVRAGIIASDKTEHFEETRYRLLKDVGPTAPKILRAHMVFDPNSESVLGEPEAKEVQS